MIEISVDEKACVSCSLCAEICPTDVFVWDEEKGVPEVAKPGECFGCLSCSEICPPHCITHRGVELAESHYHDPYALRLASRLAADVQGRFNVPSDEAAQGRAAADLGVRLRSVAEVFKRTLGGSLPAVGTMAGRTLARHLPRYREPKGLDEALALAKKQFAPAWEFETTRNGEELTIDVDRCFVRETCAREGVEIGSEMCVLFYNYLAGYLGRMGHVRLRLMNADRGATCCYKVKIYE
jgi:NAD-dependent dihydropyrimidine dehydrogenase PreA subunit